MHSYADFLALLRGAVRDHAEGDAVLAVVMCNLDSISQVDSALGYEAGDRILTLAAKRVQEVLRPSDVAGSIGRGRFACILAGLQSEAIASLAADKLVRAFEEPFDVVGGHLRITPQVGLAFLTEQAADASELLRCANMAMLEAARRGEKYRVFEWSDQELPALQFRLQTDLAQAIEESELSLIYQPQLDLHSNAIVAAEALLRWKHPREGPVSPVEILYVAERSGLMSRLTDWIAGTALRHCADCRRQGLDIGVGVNVSALAFADADIADMLDRALTLWDVPADRVVVELNESIGMTQALNSIGTLERLKELGVSLAADGFGMEQSSMMRLRELPLDEVKIGRSFVTDMLRGKANTAIVRSMIDLAHALDMRVVAGGVEDAKTCEALRRGGCDLIQGSLVSLPLSPDDLIAFVRRWGDTQPAKKKGRS
ncbi:MAG TPA: bifunctional diguanylate cyclase/phosphodiesterase [Burkholderiales bacterium]